jgi:CHAD domain-containing protein
LSELQRFVVVADGDPEILLSAVAERAGLVEVAQQAARRTFLDTADGRLRGAGTVLEVRTPVAGRRQPELIWTSIETGQTLAAVDAPVEVGSPCFAGDLPGAPGTERLAELIEMRALLAQAEVMSRLLTFALHDDEGKTTVRVVLDNSTLLGSATLPTIVELVPVRGYDRDAARLGELLAAQVTLEPVAAPLVDLARAALGAPPYLSSKLRLALDPAIDAETAWRTVLTTLAATMAANLDGTLADTDSEFLHDFRVAVRRTRSVLQEGARVLPPDDRAHWRARFKWLGDITTPTRDADVHLLDLPELMAGLPPGRVADLGPLRDLMVDEQRRAHAELAAHLGSDRYHDLVEAWDRFLADPWTGAGADAARPAPAVVAGRLATAWKRVVRDGRRIDDDVAAEALHDLRKDAKRLRYLLEAFGSLLDPAGVAVAVKALKGLQDCLGEFQDTEVQAVALAGFGDRLLARGDVPAATLLAMGAVVEHLDDRGRAARASFAERFAAFDHPDIRRVFRRLIDVPEDNG